jgi:hypothetical protein
LQDYEEAVQKGKVCNDWTEVVSQEVEMIVQNVSLANGTMVEQRLDNLIELASLTIEMQTLGTSF